MKIGVKKKNGSPVGHTRFKNRRSELLSFEKFDVYIFGLTSDFPEQYAISVISPLIKRSGCQWSPLKHPAAWGSIPSLNAEGR